MKKTSRAALLSLLLVFAVIPFAAMATVTITPTAVLIEERDRYADVNLINTSDKEESYEIGWRFYRMEEETGAYQNIDSSISEFDLTRNLIFSPRRVTLQPKTTQKIRLALRLKDAPPVPGDYRAHLEMKQTETAPPLPPEDSAPATDPGKPKVQIGIGVSVGFSIPVVYRIGKSDVAAIMGDITTHVDAKSGKIVADVPVARKGENFGLMGHLSVYHTPRGGSEKLVGEVKNANIFPEITSRTFHVTLSTPTLESGSLRVIYKDFDLTKDVIFAERTAIIGQ